jgi:hypothetical protein
MDSRQILVYVVYGVLGLLVILIFVFAIGLTSGRKKKAQKIEAAAIKSNSFNFAAANENNKVKSIVVDKAKVNNDVQRAAMLNDAPVVSQSQVIPQQDKPFNSFFDDLDQDDFRLP